VLWTRALREIDECGHHGFGLTLHQVANELAQEPAVKLLAAQSRAIDMRVAHLVALKQPLLEESLESRLDGVEGDATPLTERGMDGLGLTVGT